MVPTLRHGDLLWVMPYHKRKIRIGDVVCFTEPETSCFWAHRVVNKKNDFYFTKGDNNPHRDSFQIEKDVIIGYVKVRWRKNVAQRVCNGYAGRIGMLIRNKVVKLKKSGLA